MRSFIGFCCVVLCAAASAQTARTALNKGQAVAVQNIRLELPAGWSVHQDALVDNRLVFGFAKGTDFVNLYIQPSENLNFDSIFVNGSEVVRDWRLEPRSIFTWRILETKKQIPVKGRAETSYVSAFATEYLGHLYYGYARSSSADSAREIMTAFMDNMGPINTSRISSRSLTGPDYTGKKYYLGWGAAASGDPSMMHNEVKYDVLHTHDIFTKDIGGGYIGTKLIGPSTATASAIRAAWTSLKGQITAEDMFVQYSSGHGYSSGLGVGVSYKEIRDNALSYPAKEIIIFIMACQSGGLIDSFNQKKTEWQDWQSQGRTLMVFASSKTSENSSTGPGTDPEEQGGPNGSAGSAFGHALWKSLIGHADGYVDGVKDGYLNLGEIHKFTVKKTEDVGGHTPVSTGVYNTGLIMNKVPPKAFVDSLRGGTEGLSDEQIMEKIQQLDAAMRVQ